MRNSVVLLWLVLFLYGLVLGPHAVAGQPLSVQVSVRAVATGPRLAFVVKNVSDEPVTLEEWRLPWGQRQSVVVIAAERKSGAPLKQATLIDDVFQSPKVTINPGKSLSGEIDLTHYVADIDSKLRKTDLILFWYYNSRGVAGSLGEYGGWLSLAIGSLASARRSGARIATSTDSASARVL
jgi:hypothetical protein